MTTLLYKNNASTTLQSSINGTQVTAVLATGTGSMFPVLGAGQSFYLTFLDAATELISEIVLVTARSGDAITMVRAQGGTSARAWSASDIAAQLTTAEDLAQGIQPDQLQSGVYSMAQGGGSVNSITAAIASQLTSANLPDGLPVVFMASGANTGNATLTVTLGSTVHAAVPILKGAGSQLQAGDIPAANYPVALLYSLATNAFFMLNPASGTAGSINGGAANQLLMQTAPSTTGFVAAPTVAGSILSFVGGIVRWATAAVLTFNGRSGTVVPATGDYTPAQVGAVATADVTGAYQQMTPNSLYKYLAGAPGLTASRAIIQAGFFSPTTDVSTVTFPLVFPNACIAVFVEGYTNSSGSVTNPQASDYRGQSPATYFTLRAQTQERPIVWFAIGY